MRRAWAALAYGRWRTAQLLAAWQRVIQADGHWQASRQGGYRPVACDRVGVWRPRLQGWPTQHSCAQAGKALPAISLGIAARLGAVGAPRLAVPCLLVRTAADEPGAVALPQRLFQQTQALLAPDEALVTARGCPLAQIHAGRGARGLSGVAQPTVQRDVPPMKQRVRGVSSSGPLMSKGRTPPQP